MLCSLKNTAIVWCMAFWKVAITVTSADNNSNQLFGPHIFKNLSTSTLDSSKEQLF